jgi:hypothetical protein
VRTLQDNTPATLYFLGASLIADGVANLFSAFYTSSYQRRLGRSIRDEALAELEAKGEKSKDAEEAPEDKS